MTCAYGLEMSLKQHALVFVDLGTGMSIKTEYQYRHRHLCEERSWR